MNSSALVVDSGQKLKELVPELRGVRESKVDLVQEIDRFNEW